MKKQILKVITREEAEEKEYTIDKYGRVFDENNVFKGMVR